MQTQPEQYSFDFKSETAEIVAESRDELNLKMGEFAGPLDLLLYLCRIVANNYDGFTNLRSFECSDDSFDKGLAVDGKQRFGTPHAARFTRG